MIRFTCEHCGQKIRVNDNVAGKKGRCPNCKQPVSIPEPELIKLVSPTEPTASDLPSAQSMIQHKCDICSNAMSSPREEQGNIKECPRCSSFVEVPVLQKKSIPDIDNGIQFQPKPAAQNDVEESLPSRCVKPSSAVYQKPKRSLPIFLDVFLFPVSKSGVITLLAFTLAPIILYPIAFLGIFGSLLYLIAMVCAWAYMFWYFSLCIHKSAEGAIRAPDTFHEDANTSMTDMVIQMFRTIILIILCLLPSIIYGIATRSSGVVFYALLAGGVFFLPMLLLASVMFDSFWAAWNPRVILGGMFSSFFSYLALVLVFYIPAGLYYYISQLGRDQENLVLALTLNACSIYLIMVSAHLLGWFFYKNEEKLFWSV